MTLLRTCCVAGLALAGLVAQAQIKPTVANTITLHAYADNWQEQIDPAGVATAAVAAGAFALSSGSKDSALVLTLAPGAYTFRVTGAGGATGVALVEVYALP